MIALYKDPKGEMVFKKFHNNCGTITTQTNFSKVSESGVTNTSTANNDNELGILREKVIKLEEKLKEYENKA